MYPCMQDDTAILVFSVMFMDGWFVYSLTMIFAVHPITFSAQTNCQKLNIKMELWAILMDLNLSVDCGYSSKNAPDREKERPSCCSWVTPSSPEDRPYLLWALEKWNEMKWTTVQSHLSEWPEGHPIHSRLWGKQGHNLHKYGVVLPIRDMMKSPHLNLLDSHVYFMDLFRTHTDCLANELGSELNQTKMKDMQKEN